MDDLSKRSHRRPPKNGAPAPSAVVWLADPPRTSNDLNLTILTIFPQVLAKPVVTNPTNLTILTQQFDNLAKYEPARPVPQPRRETALAIRAILPLTPPTIKLNFCHFLGA